MNQVILTGNVGKDPQRSDYSVDFTLATTRSYRNRNNEDVKETMWHNISCRGFIKEDVWNSLRKGDLVCVFGEAKQREYTGKDGRKSYFNYVEASTVWKALPRSGKSDNEDMPM